MLSVCSPKNLMSSTETQSLLASCIQLSRPGPQGCPYMPRWSRRLPSIDIYSYIFICIKWVWTGSSSNISDEFGIKKGIFTVLHICNSSKRSKGNNDENEGEEEFGDVWEWGIFISWGCGLLENLNYWQLTLFWCFFIMLCIFFISSQFPLILLTSFPCKFYLMKFSTSSSFFPDRS